MVITDRDIRRASVVRAAGHPVHTLKLQCSPRAAFEYPDTPEVRRLLDSYENGEPLPISQKLIFKTHIELLTECKRLQVGRIGGGL